MRWARLYGVELALVTALALAVAFFGYLAMGLLPRAVEDEDFAGSRALADAGRQVSFGNRATATRGNIELGNWLVQQLTTLGWSVVIEEFTIAESVRARNIIAVRSPAEVTSAPVALIASHYDTRLAADADPLPENQARPAGGANNGASGTAILLELARTLDVEATGHTICLAFFDAEANDGIPGWEGRLGSSHFARNVAQDMVRCAAPRVVVGVDLAGAQGARFLPEPSGNEALNATLWAQAADLGFGESFVAEPGPQQRNAHSPWAEQGIPAALIADAAFPHTRTLADTVDRLSQDTLQQVGRTLEEWLEQGAPLP